MNRLIALLCLLPLVSFGIEPLIIKLELNESYTVPTNKVLLIENITAAEQHNYRFIIMEIVSAGKTNLAYFGVAPDHYPESIKIPGASVLTNKSDEGPIGGFYYTLYCLLVDPADLYAHIGNKSGGMIVGNGLFSFDVQAASARPARIEVEGSTDLATWQRVDATVTKNPSSTYTVSIPVEDEQKYFAKYTVRGVNP